MNILIIHCSFIYTGGGERIVLEQIDNLRRRGNKVVCYAPVLDEKNCFPDIIKKYNIKTFLPQLPRWVPLRHAIIMLLTCLVAPLYAGQMKKYDVIIGENQPGAWIAYILSKLSKKPYIVYLNHPNRILYPREHEDWAAVKDFRFLSILFYLFKPMMKYLDSHSIKSASQRLINGVFIGKEIEKIYNVKWVACTSGAIRINDYVERTKNQEKLNINEVNIDRPYILYTGRHQPWKRIDWLIEIASLVNNSNQNFYLVIPGSPTPHTDELKKKTKELNAQEYILFPGDITQHQLKQLYLHASVYAFPSEKEDFGIVVIEAMGHGVPAVAWNIGGPTDSIVNNETGYLIEPYSKEKFAEALTRLLREKTTREEMGKSALKHVSKNFSWTKHTNIIEKHLKAAMMTK